MRLEDPVGIEQHIQQIKSGVRPVDQWIGECAEEVFLSGKFGSAFLEGSIFADSTLTPEAYRVLRVTGKGFEIASYVITIAKSPKNREHQESADLLKAKCQRLDIISQVEQPISHIMPLLIEHLVNSGLHTPAAMTFYKSIPEGKRVVTVSYPLAFMEFCPIKSQEKDFAFYAAAHLLKRVPFGNTGFSMNLPSS